MCLRLAAVMRKTMAVFAVLMPEAYCVCRSGVICCICGIDCTNLIGPSGQICDTAEFAIVRRSTLALGWIRCFASLSHPFLSLLGCSRGGSLALLIYIFSYNHLHLRFPWLVVSSAPLPLPPEFSSPTSEFPTVYAPYAPTIPSGNQVGIYLLPFLFLL